jgi:hypothetical protein
VSAKLVVKLAAVIVAVALAFNNVPLGLPALSVSSLTIKSVLGDAVLQRASFNVVQATPVPIKGNDTLVFPATSPIFCLFVANANVVQVSTKRLSH